MTTASRMTRIWLEKYLYVVKTTPRLEPEGLFLTHYSEVFDKSI